MNISGKLRLLCTHTPVVYPPLLRDQYHEFIMYLSRPLKIL